MPGCRGTRSRGTRTLQQTSAGSAVGVPPQRLSGGRHQVVAFEVDGLGPPVGGSAGRESR